MFIHFVHISDLDNYVDYVVCVCFLVLVLVIVLFASLLHFGISMVNGSRMFSLLVYSSLLLLSMAKVEEIAAIAACEAHVEAKSEMFSSLGLDSQSQSSLHKDLESILSSIQHPPPGPWGFHDVKWTMKLSSVRGPQKKSLVVQQCYVNSNRANDFIAGMEGGKDGISCKYFVIQRYGFKSASRMRYNSPLLFRR